VSDPVLRLGLDLAEVPRIAAALDRWGERFVSRIFVDGELSTRRVHREAFAQHVAGRFAAKEAAMKALGTGWRGLGFREIVVGRERSGKPTLLFTGSAKARADAMKVFQAEVTITHTGSMAAAVVALLCRAK